MGVLYILDRQYRSASTRTTTSFGCFERLRDLGNTLIVVEHDEDTMYAADHIIDIGPGAGVSGGRVANKGVEDIKVEKNSKQAFI